MRVLITGATGMVGCHAAAAIAEAGHSVRVLARSPEKASAVLEPFGAELGVDFGAELDVAQGDVTDAASVEKALRDCDAVVHAAGLLTFDRRRADEMLHTNIEGTRLVLEAARAARLDPIVYVSSVAALFSPGGSILTPQTSVQNPRDPYARSKAEGERIARAMQVEGDPVVCIYPGGVWGPNDPTLGSQITTIFAMVKAGYYLCPPSGVPIVDARDLGRAIAASLRPGRGPRRYMLSGHYTTHDELRLLFASLTGRRFLRVPTPSWLLRVAGRAGDWLRNHTGFDPGAVTYESMLTATSTQRGDDSLALDELSLRLRPVEETVRDQMRWMGRVGFLSRRQLGSLAD